MQIKKLKTNKRKINNRMKAFNGPYNVNQQERTLARLLK